MTTFDTVIIGGGHNGLICATLLAQAGQKVVVVEANPHMGGLAMNREFHPGFSTSVAQTLYALPQVVMDALALDQHGFDIEGSSLENHRPINAGSPCGAFRRLPERCL